MIDVLKLARRDWSVVRGVSSVVAPYNEDSRSSEPGCLSALMRDAAGVGHRPSPGTFIDPLSSVAGIPGAYVAPNALHDLLAIFYSWEIPGKQVVHLAREKDLRTSVRVQYM